MAKSSEIDLILQQVETLRKAYQDAPCLCFTMDIDWASEYAIQRTLSYFKSLGIPLTVFLTHYSSSLQRELACGTIRAGIHPNFLGGSSQGDSFVEILDYLFRIHPSAKCFRSHRYFEVNDVMEEMWRRGLRYCSNVCTLFESVQPFVHRSGMISFPIFFEDGAYLYHGYDVTNPQAYSSFFERFLTPGLKVINIHPMHFMLNTPYFTYAREIKDKLTREEWADIGDTEMTNLSWSGYGIANLIRGLVEYSIDRGIETTNLEDAYLVTEC